MKAPFKQIIKESFSKTFNYRIKFAGNITNEGIKQLENILGKYGVESVSSAKRTPIQDEPLDFKNNLDCQISMNKLADYLDTDLKERQVTLAMVCAQEEQKINI